MFKHVEQMHGERRIFSWHLFRFFNSDVTIKFILIYIWIELAFDVDINQIQIMKEYQ